LMEPPGPAWVVNTASNGNIPPGASTQTVVWLSG
jgi:hypothetical protein